MNAQLKPSESEEASTPLLRIDAAGSELLRPAEQWRAFLLPVRKINNLTNWHKFHVMLVGVVCITTLTLYRGVARLAVEHP